MRRALAVIGLVIVVSAAATVRPVDLGMRLQQAYRCHCWGDFWDIIWTM